jgi:hypothetical protein
MVASNGPPKSAAATRDAAGRPPHSIKAELAGSRRVAKMGRSIPTGSGQVLRHYKKKQRGEWS